MERKKIVVATKNQGKLKELIHAFADLPIELISLSEFGKLPDAVEDGNTFYENALKKARFYMEKTHCACLADDSGIEIEVLGGAPGIHSARFAGYHADDKANNQKMLEELASKGVNSSKAQYVCSLVFVDTDGTILATKGVCEGIIRNIAQGSGGFGYDPYFYLPQFAKTMAELTIEAKNEISHRGKAIEQMEMELRNYYENRNNQ